MITRLNSNLDAFTEEAILDLYETSAKSMHKTMHSLGWGKIKMFSYTLSMEPNNKIFANACTLIDSQFGIAGKERELTDVDGSKIQVYNTPDGEIKVMSDYDVYAVYIDSNIDLTLVLTKYAKSYGIQTWINNQWD